MYRVELKVATLRRAKAKNSWQFLMYRVELKGISPVAPQVRDRLFLMYRVELKDQDTSTGFSLPCRVPNVPCGVESQGLLFFG